MLWRGVHTALVTPFADGKLDLDAWESTIARQVRGGVHGVVVAGTTGESPTLSNDERDTLLVEALGVVNQRVPVTMGVGTNSTRSTVEYCERAKELGADAGLLVLPYYNKPNPAGLLAHVRAAAEVGLPLIVYHVPGRTAQRIPAGQLAELCETSGVVAVKEATGDVIYGQEFMLQSACPVLSGDDFSWLPLLSVGAAGVISVLSNVAPRQTAAVYDAWIAGRVSEAAKAHRALFPVAQFLFAEVNPVPAKAMMSDMGLCRNELRLPLAPGTLPPEALIRDLA
jgi:4-hydroxy-tetrahydrodipicolinate synthase